MPRLAGLHGIPPPPLHRAGPLAGRPSCTTGRTSLVSGGFTVGCAPRAVAPGRRGRGGRTRPGPWRAWLPGCGFCPTIRVGRSPWPRRCAPERRGSPDACDAFGPLRLLGTAAAELLVEPPVDVAQSATACRVAEAPLPAHYQAGDLPDDPLQCPIRVAPGQASQVVLHAVGGAWREAKATDSRASGPGEDCYLLPARP